MQIYEFQSITRFLSPNLTIKPIFRYVKTIQTEDDILKERKRMGL